MWTLANPKTVLANFLAQKEPSYLDLKIKTFKNDDNKDFRLVQYLTMGKAAFNQIIRLKNQPVIAADNLGEEENLSFVLKPTRSKDKEEQLKLAHKVVHLMDRANRNICVTLLQCNVDKPKNLYVHVLMFWRKKDDEKFQQLVYVNYKLEEVVYLLDVMSSQSDRVLTDQPICKIL